VLYEFAITPDVFDRRVIGVDALLAERLDRVLEGIEHNGLLADLHSGMWQRRIGERLRDAPADVRDQIQARLKRLHDWNRLTLHHDADDEPGDDAGWQRSALSCGARAPFHGVLVSKAIVPTGGTPRLLELADVLASARWKETRDGTQASIPRTPTAVRRLIDPLVKYAQRVHLVDPYCSPAPRFATTVDIVAELMGRGWRDPSPVPRLHVHSAARPRPDEAYWEAVERTVEEWRRYLGQLTGRYPREYRVSLWRERPGGERFHDRFILTDQCGVAVQGGLDCAPGWRSTTLWSILQERIRSQEWEKLVPQRGIYEHVRWVAIAPDGTWSDGGRQ
jgi:hypothetical protein